MIYALEIACQDAVLMAQAQKYGIDINPDQGTIATRDQVLKLGSSATIAKCRMEIHRMIRIQKEKEDAKHLAKQTSLL